LNFLYWIDWHRKKLKIHQAQANPPPKPLASFATFATFATFALWLEPPESPRVLTCQRAAAR